MKHPDAHHQNPEPVDGIFEKLEIPYEKSRSQVWSSLETSLREPSERSVRIVWLRRSVYAAAASLLLLGAITGVMRFYITTVSCPAGQHLTLRLPDGSGVTLNAVSELTYHPLWWRFERKLKFEGEAFFEVEKGRKFTVSSALGTTEVLGTSFNIYARDQEYKVSCMTGKVKVTSGKNAEAIISPDYAAEVTPNGDIAITKTLALSESNAWISNMFSFTARPFSEVINEIARQYAIEIYSDSPLPFTYTGYFTKNRPVEETLHLVCAPFGLTFVEISGQKYKITHP